MKQKKSRTRLITSSNISIFSQETNYDKESKLYQLNCFFDTKYEELNKILCENEYANYKDKDEYILFDQSKLIFLYETFEYISFLTNNKDIEYKIVGAKNINVLHISLLSKDIFYSSNPYIQVKKLTIMLLFVLGAIGKNLAIVLILYYLLYNNILAVYNSNKQNSR